MFLFCLLLSACLPPLPPEVIAPTQTVAAAYARMRPAFIDNFDMSLGWRQNFTMSTSRLAGGVGNTVSFRRPSDVRSWNFLYQDIYFFEDSELASAGFQEVVKETVPAAAAESYTVPPELEFAMQADAAVIGCLPMSVDGEGFVGCSMAAHYGNYVTKIHANIVPFGGLSLPRFGFILKRVDEKMTALRGS